MRRKGCREKTGSPGVCHRRPGSGEGCLEGSWGEQHRCPVGRDGCLEGSQGERHRRLAGRKACLVVFRAGFSLESTARPWCGVDKTETRIFRKKRISRKKLRMIQKSEFLQKNTDRQKKTRNSRENGFPEKMCIAREMCRILENTGFWKLEKNTDF